MKKDVKGMAGNHSGVTLIELLVVLAIIGIIMVIGVNMMGGVVAKHRLRSAANELQAKLRAAQMLSVVKNEPVTVVIVNAAGTAKDQADSYYACLDTNVDGLCTSGVDEYLNLDSGRTGAVELATAEYDQRIEIYDVNSGSAGLDANSFTFMPPSGLPPSSGILNGVICFEVQTEDSGDWNERYSARRVTVNPLVGKATMWKSDSSGLLAHPDCRNGSDDNTGWEKVF